MRIFILTGILAWQCCVLPLAGASEADVLWERAVTAVQDREPDLAFVNFHLLVNTCSSSQRDAGAYFSMGEYYFRQGTFDQAALELNGVYAKYPKSKEALVALAYLYKIALMRGRADEMARYQKMLVSAHRVAFIFKDSKSFEYISGFRRTYTLVFRIDRIEVFIDGKLFVEIPG